MEVVSRYYYPGVCVRHFVFRNRVFYVLLAFSLI